MGFIVLWVLSWHSELQNVAATQLCLRNLKLWTVQSRVLHLQVRRRVAKVHVVEVQVANAANSPPPAPAPIKPPKTPVKTPAAKQPAMKLPAKTLPPKARMYRVAVSTCHHLSRMAFDSPTPSFTKLYHVLTRLRLLFDPFCCPFQLLFFSLSCGIEVRWPCSLALCSSSDGFA